MPITIQEQAEEDTVKAFEVNQSIRELCRTLDGFIFVVDASEVESSGNNNNNNLKTFFIASKNLVSVV